MAPDDVPPSDMELSPLHFDEIDAAMADPTDVGLTDVATVVNDLKTAYLADTPLRRSAALTEFLAAPIVGEATQPSRRGLKVVAAATAGIAGKVLLGTAVAAASVAGLQASGIVDVPGLPHRGEVTAPAVDDEETTTTLDDGVEASMTDDGISADTDRSESEAPGQTVADEARTNQEAAAQFTTSMQEWSACIDAAGGDVAAREACGERPHPRDFGLGESPADAGRPEWVPGPPSETPGAGNGNDNGPPTDAGPPAHAGPPTDAGPPAQAGPPADNGEPQGAGGGRPEGAGGGRP
jgi:hypothetical protein